jgi:trk system potassium uptake protein TrkH
MSLRHEALSSTGHDVAPQVNRQHLIRDVFLFTLTAEAFGALALYLLWLPDLDKLNWTHLQAAWHAVFHAISAFCNAGITTFPNSMFSFRHSPLVLGVVMSLVILGGIGFLTLEELKLHRQAGKFDKRFRISLHTRLVVWMTGILLLSGWLLFTSFEWNYTLRTMGLRDKLVNGLFMSVTSRSGGFHTIDYGDATASTSYLTILFMSIGGSPGSTAGGMKTTTIALIGLLAWSRLRGRLVVSVAGRSVPDETIQRAVGLFVIAFALMTLSIFMFSAMEIRGESPPAFILYMFEAVSAFSTAGLSMGVTHELSELGRWLTILLMFFGRVGPLTLAAALARPRKQIASEFRYAYEDVVVG